MRNLIAAIGILTLMCGTSALAAEKLLTDRQLDTVTAGVNLAADNVQQEFTGNQVDPQINNPNLQNQTDNQGSDALNIVNTPIINVDNSVDGSQNINSKNDFIVLKDGAQEYVKAVNVVNSVQSQVANGVNMHFDSLRPDALSGGSAGGSLNNLYQTNIINLNRNAK